MKSIVAIAAISSLCFCPASVSGDEHPASGFRQMIRQSREDYTFMWWAYGWRGAKIRCLQTSTYGMAMDVKRMSVPHFGTIADTAPYERAVAQSNDVVFRLPAAEMELSVEAGGRRHVCVSGGHPRLIESGRFLQRSDVQGLVLRHTDGEALPADCRLEIVAWPDWLSFILDVTPREDMKAARATIRFRAKSGSVEESSAASDWLSGETQTVSAALDAQPSGGNTSKHGSIVRACSHGDSRALPVSYDSARGWYKVEIPAESRGKPNAARLQRIRVSLRNPDAKPQAVRLNFARDGNVPAITGLVPLLRDAGQNPIGIPVQISKNWHRRQGKTFLYEGGWLHALTMLRLPAGFDGELEFCIARNFWGEVPLASHAQLCLIGWGTDQLWDQAAIGSWGESICYDPDVCLQRSVIDDVRPLMVTRMKSIGGKWGWTNNVGGGDFLVYYDQSNRKQFLSRMRTAYLSQGPNLTDVIYAGTSADGNIAVSLRVLTPRCDDINRAYHMFRYDVLKPTRFKRLAFYQLGADSYNDHQFRKLARGSDTGMLQQWEAPPDGQLGYHRRGIPCPGRMPWFSLHEAVSKDVKGGAWANRGLVVRCWRARLGGSDSPPFAACYGTKNGPSSCNIELVPPPGLTELKPGDFVEATVELLVLPQYAKDYYGPNEKLRQDLEANENTWRPVLRQAVHGALTVSVSKGELLQSCPVRIKIDSSQQSEFVITGGVGYSPITFTGLGDYRGWKLQRRASGRWSVVDQSVFGNDFWQIDATADGRFAITFNVLLDAGSGVQRFRLTKGLLQNGGSRAYE